MSRTYNDRPIWVKKFDPDYGFTDHNHTKGVCLVETLKYARKYSSGVSYIPASSHMFKTKCKKNTSFPYYCDDEGFPFSGHYDFTRRGVCYMTRPCPGHVMFFRNEEIPCACGSLEDEIPTCDRVPNYSCYFVGDGPDRAFIRANYHAPERQRARITLGQIADEYNTFQDLDEITDDYFPHPARGSAMRDWY